MKKTIPLIIHQSLEKFVHLKGVVFKVIEPDGFLFKIIDNDINSDFYFNIERTELGKDHKHKIIIDYKPYHLQSITNRPIAIESKDLELFFSKWLELIESYETVKSFYDDPVANAFAEEYYAEFEILEEPYKPFKTNQILFLDEYLENIEKDIEKFVTEKNSTAIQEIKNEVIILRENLTTQSKAWVAKKLSIIWGKIAKQGAKFIKEFIIETKKQAIQKGVKFLIEHGPDVIKTIGENLN